MNHVVTPIVEAHARDLLITGEEGEEGRGPSALVNMILEILAD